jgi:hypothetical protein
MEQALVRIVIGYALASAAAAAVVMVELPLIAGAATLTAKDYLAAVLMIGVFAWAGFFFAVWSRIKGWTQVTTFLMGGLFAMAVGVATMSGLGILLGLWQGSYELDRASALSACRNIVELLSVGILPGLAGGGTYWLVAVPKSKPRAN